MTIPFQCSVCRARYYIPAQLVGRNADCPVCLTSFVVPAAPGMSEDEVAALVATDPLRPYLKDQEQTGQGAESEAFFDPGPG